jgi:hypothetical protein
LVVKDRKKVHFFTIFQSNCYRAHGKQNRITCATNLMEKGENGHLETKETIQHSPVYFNHRGVGGTNKSIKMSVFTVKHRDQHCDMKKHAHHIKRK